MKVLIALGVIFVFGLIQPIFAGLLSAIDYGYGVDGATRAGLVNGIFSVAYYGIMIYVIRVAFNTLDKKKEKKEISAKEAEHRQEREARQRKTMEDLDKKLASESFEEYQIEHMIRCADITPDQKGILRQKYLLERTCNACSNSGE